jgi:hypothetical protein
MRFLVAIETDATRYHGEHASRPRLLNDNDASQMLAHLATDLSAQFPQIKSCSLCLPGALFDQTQLLRPEYPVFSALELNLEENPDDGGPSRRAIGEKAGRMPSDLQPSPEIPLGILQTLPIVCMGEASVITELSEEMEHRFLESGQCSAHTAKALEANFRIVVNHARFMTVTDLNAMLHLQLEHFGFLPLWQLLDTAMNHPATRLDI